MHCPLLDVLLVKTFLLTLWTGFILATIAFMSVSFKNFFTLVVRKVNFIFIRKWCWGNSLMVQWLGAQISSLVKELRSSKPHSAAKKKKICCWGKSCHECPIEDNSIKPCCLVAKLCPALLWQPQRSPPGSSVHGVSQTRVLEWVAIAFSRGCSRPRDQTQVSRISGRFFTTEPPGKPHRIVWERQSPNSKERLMMQTLCYAV